MHAALLAALPAYTAAVALACRRYWARRCAECAYRSRTAHPAGRHRARALPVNPTRRRPALPRAPRVSGLPAGRTTPARPALPAGAEPAGHAWRRAMLVRYADRSICIADYRKR